MLSAGEASGDRLGAGLARALKARAPDVEIFGMGGPEMEAAGVRLVEDASRVAVVGIVEVLAHLSEIRAAMGKLEDVLRRERPDVLVPIDFPDFHFRLCARARRAEVPVAYFVSPQVWAWRRGRVRTLRRLVERMLVLFPFEVPFYEEAGVPVTFVGHPVVERVAEGERRPDLLEKAGLDPHGETVALLPGSRRGEIARHLPTLLEAASRLRVKRPEVQFLISRAATVAPGVLEDPVEASGLQGVAVHAGDFPQILTACDAGAVASGTATLEAAMAGLPMVVGYRMAPVSYTIGRALVRVDHVAMPNLVAGRRVVPELIQGAFTAETVASEIERMLDDPDRAAEIRRGLADVRRRLGGPGAYERAADAVLQVVASSTPAPEPR